jgi:hypothetical protein
LLFLVLLASCYEREPIRANQGAGRPVEIPLLVVQSLHADFFALRRLPFWVSVRERGCIVAGRGRTSGDRCRQNAYRDPSLCLRFTVGLLFSQGRTPMPNKFIFSPMRGVLYLKQDRNVSRYFVLCAVVMDTCNRQPNCSTFRVNWRGTALDSGVALAYPEARRNAEGQCVPDVDPGRDEGVPSPN